MILYIVRHAIPVPHGAPAVPEDERPLTEEGIEKMKKAAGGLKGLDVRPDIILTSPLVRARQTAEILRRTLGGKAPLETCDALSPAGDRQQLYQALQQHSKLDSLMLVGHQPSLGEIAGEIAWGSTERYVELKKGGACCIEILTLQPRPRGAILWIVTPAILRALG